MKRDVSPAPTTDVPQGSNAALAVLASLADTTWRVAVPTVVLAGAGIYVDKRIGTMPLFTIGGLVVGLVVAGKLVWDQLQKVKKLEDRT